MRFDGCSGPLPVIGSGVCAGEGLLGDYGAVVAPGELGVDHSVVWGRALARDGRTGCVLFSVVIVVLVWFVVGSC